MVHEYRFDNSNGVCVYDFKNNHDDTYNFRGILPGFKEGDILRMGPTMGFSSKTDFQFIEITSIKDSAGKFQNPLNAIQSLIEGKVKSIINEPFNP